MKILGILVSSLVLVTYLLTWSAYNNLYKAKEKSLWPTTPATIQKGDISYIPTKYGRRYVLDIDYAYSISNEKYTGYDRCYSAVTTRSKQPEWTQSQIAHCDTGKTILIHFNPQNPKQSTLRSFGPSNLFSSFNFLGLMLILILATAVLIQLIKLFPWWRFISVCVYCVAMVGGAGYIATIVN